MDAQGDDIDTLISEKAVESEMDDNDQIAHHIEALSHKKWTTEEKYKKKSKFLEKYERDAKVLIIATIVFAMFALPATQKIIASFVSPVGDGQYTIVGLSAIAFFVVVAIAVSLLVDDTTMPKKKVHFVEDA
jgi:hypothetical protein